MLLFLPRHNRYSLRLTLSYGPAVSSKQDPYMHTFTEKLGTVATFIFRYRPIGDLFLWHGSPFNELNFDLRIAPSQWYRTVSR